MIKGTVYVMERTCGNPNCKCARGEKHAGTYLSWSENGATRLKYVRRKDRVAVEFKTRNHRLYQKWMAEFRKIEDEIILLIGHVRDDSIAEYK